MSGRTRPMVIGLCAEAILDLERRMAKLEETSESAISAEAA
jgi:hypothetical protein